MKKILILTMLMMLVCTSAYAGKRRGVAKEVVQEDMAVYSQEYREYQEAMRRDYEASQKAIKEYKEAVSESATVYKENAKDKLKENLKAKKEENERIYQEKVEQKNNEINHQLRQINEEMDEIENASDMTITEKTIRKRLLKRKMDFYNKQKKALE